VKPGSDESSVDDDVTSANSVVGDGVDDADHSILVPLEFSGGSTRVLTDPDEIKEIHCHEMERYYHRKYVSNLVSTHGITAFVKTAFLLTTLVLTTLVLTLFQHL